MFVYLKTNDVDFQAQPRQEAPVVIMNRTKLQKKMTFYFRKVNILNFQTICSLPQKQLRLVKTKPSRPSFEDNHRIGGYA